MPAATAPPAPPPCPSPPPPALDSPGKVALPGRHGETDAQVDPENLGERGAASSLDDRRPRKRGRRGHHRDRHDARRRRFQREKRWRRGQPLRRKRRRSNGDGWSPGTGPAGKGPEPADQATHEGPSGATSSTKSGNPGSDNSSPGNTQGFTLVDLLVALTILAILAVLTVPPLTRASEQMRLRMAASEASRIFFLARSYAVRHSAHVGVKFRPGEEAADTTWTLYVDGDGDGVRTADVVAGLDPPVPAPGGDQRRPARFHGVRLGFPPGPLPRDPGGHRLTRRDDPVRFNRSDIASFGPLGTATPGSLYLTDGRNLAAVRVTGRSGHIRTLIYDAEAAAWK